MKNFSRFVLILAAIGLMAFGFYNKTTQKTEIVKLQDGLKKQKTSTSSTVDKLLGSKKLTKRKYNPNAPFSFFIRGTYSLFTTKEKLKEVKTIDEIIPNYPTGWISDYIEVEISSSRGNKTIKSKDNKLTAEQIKLLENAQISDKLQFEVKYQALNSINNKIEDHQMEPIEITIVPETEAEYSGGVVQLVDYFENNYLDKLEDLGMDMENQQITILFTINETGMVEDIVFDRPSEKEEINTFLKDAVLKMGRWTPAKDATGKTVKQQFELTVGNLMGC